MKKMEINITNLWKNKTNKATKSLKPYKFQASDTLSGTD